MANQETGVVQDLSPIAGVVRRRAPNAVLHTDAVQAARWEDLAVRAASADLISVSGHKWGGPQGSGALGIRDPSRLRPIIHGGGQERELRSGTQNVVAAVGLGAAASASAAERPELVERVRGLRDELSALIRAEVPGCTETAVASERLPGHLHLLFPGIENEALLVLLDDAGVCASAGSACSSGATEPSAVLLAMGIPKEEATGALRLSLGPATSRADIEVAAAEISKAVRRLVDA